AMRVRVARLMGTQDEDAFAGPLTSLLADSDAWVRRTACESIAHRGKEQPAEALVNLLGAQDPFVAFAARRTLESIPAAEWQDKVLTSPKWRVFLQGSAGLLAASPSRELADQVLAHCEALLSGNARDPGQLGRLSEADLRDKLRVVQLALIR